MGCTNCKEKITVEPNENNLNVLLDLFDNPLNVEVESNKVVYYRGRWVNQINISYDGPLDPETEDCSRETQTIELFIIK